MRENPEVVKIFLEETEKAIEWIHGHHDEAANMSYELMGIPPEEVKLFLSRVHYEYGASEDVLKQITHYIEVLNKAGYGGKPFGELEGLFI